MKIEIAMMVLRSLVLVCGLLIFGVAATSSVHGETIVVGVNVVNPQRLSTADREKVLDRLQAAGVHVIRAPLAPAWSGSDYGPAIDFIHHAFARGIKTDLIVGLQYREGAQRRPPVRDMPKMWPSYPLSAADPVRFRAVFEPLFAQFESLGVIFAVLELGNEINGAGFNGDFPIPGEGRIFGGGDLAVDPEGRQIAEGYRAYLRCLKVLKDIRDHSRLNRATPILSAGLADPGNAGPRPGLKADAVSIGATLDYLRTNGLDALVDAYGVHTYLWAKPGVAARRGQLEEDTFAKCGAAGRGKPCWLTEWGVPAFAPGCDGADPARTALITEMLADFRPFVQRGRLTGLLYYAWSDNTYGLYRCGALTESGRLALDNQRLE